MQCELCDKSYERRAWLARHMQDAHGARLDSPDLDDVFDNAVAGDAYAAGGAPEPFTDAAVTWVQPDAAQTTRIRNLRRSGMAFPEAFESVMGVVPPPEVIATYTPPAVNRLDGMAERVRAGRASTPDVLYLYRLALIGRDAVAAIGNRRWDGGLDDGEQDIIDRWEAADQ